MVDSQVSAGILSWFTVADWKKGLAFTVLWAYVYQLTAWPLLFWGTTLITAFTGFQIPAPPIVPWEQLIAGTTTLATVGGLQALRDKWTAPEEPRVP